jgi:hypothetical protein
MATINWKSKTDTDAEALANAKHRKQVELNSICNDKITNFTYDINGVTYNFSYDIEAQNNFRDAREAIADGLATEVEWTAYIASTGERVRIMLNGADLTNMRLVQFNQKHQIIAEFNSILLDILNPATTVDQVNAVGWTPVTDASGTPVDPSGNPIE